jgi:hypothetical protein
VGVVERAKQQEVVREVPGIEFSPDLAPWLERYRAVGDRPDLLWKWCCRGVRLITLPSVDPSLREHLADTKLLNILFTTLVDDLVDSRRDAQMFAASEGIAAGGEEVAGFDEPRRRYLEVTRDVWRELWRRAGRYPRFPEMRPYLEYDYAQIMNAMRYALLVNQSPAGLCLVEHDLYVSHNLTVVFMGMIDLCASRGFDLDELGAMRAIFWEAQRMARIGDTLMTWEREVRERDASSGVFAYALAHGVLGSEELRTRPVDELRERLRASGFEADSLAEWRRHRDGVVVRSRRLRSVDLTGFIAGLEELLELHLAFQSAM